MFTDDFIYDITLSINKKLYINTNLIDNLKIENAKLYQMLNLSTAILIAMKLFPTRA